MKLNPKNDWVQVSPAFDKKEEEIEKSLVALPEDYKPMEKPYKAVSVIKDSLTGPKRHKAGDIVVVPTHVIREIEIRDNKFYLVERNHIMAAVTV